MVMAMFRDAWRDIARMIPIPTRSWDMTANIIAAGSELINARVPPPKGNYLLQFCGK
jgi:hypothetical protein